MCVTCTVQSLQRKWTKQFSDPLFLHMCSLKMRPLGSKIELHLELQLKKVFLANCLQEATKVWMWKKSYHCKKQGRMEIRTASKRNNLAKKKKKKAVTSSLTVRHYTQHNILTGIPAGYWSSPSGCRNSGHWMADVFVFEILHHQITCLKEITPW